MLFRALVFSYLIWLASDVKADADPEEIVIVVASAAEFRSAVDGGAQHIEITRHLNLTNVATNTGSSCYDVFCSNSKLQSVVVCVLELRHPRGASLRLACTMSINQQSLLRTEHAVVGMLVIADVHQQVTLLAQLV